MAVCNQHLDHGPISIELDGSVILELADRLISDPGVHIEIGAERRDEVRPEKERGGYNDPTPYAAENT